MFQGEIGLPGPPGHDGEKVRHGASADCSFLQCSYLEVVFSISVTAIAQLLFPHGKKIFCFTKMSIHGLSKSQLIRSSWDGMANVPCPAHDSSNGLTVSKRMSSESL